MLMDLRTFWKRLISLKKAIQAYPNGVIDKKNCYYKNDNMQQFTLLHICLNIPYILT